MNIWFIGGLFPKERINEFVSNSKNTIQYAADNFQWTFIKGLDCYYNKLRIFTSPLLTSFPLNYKRLITKSSTFSHDQKSKDLCVGFINLPFIGLISKFINLLLVFLVQKEKANHLIIYSLHTPYVLSSLFYKKIHKNVKLTLVVPDLPEYMSSKNNLIHNFLKKTDINILRFSMKKIDSFIFITDKMAEHFDTKNKPWVRIEGMFDNERLTTDAKNTNLNKKEKIILYSGTLDSRYGITNLIDAFKSINNDNYKLWVCGEGNSKDIIEELSKSDSRVVYFGQVTTEKAVELQNLATLLINPRTSEGEYTKYSFPIKTMEYLATGTPTVMNMLPGIPEEYRDFINVPITETAEGLKDMIIKVCDCKDDFYRDKAKAGQRFIFKYKNPKTQTKKIFEMLSC